MSNKDRNSFYIQGSILAAASILTRILGLIFRIPLTGIIGDEGNGAYSNAYEIYNNALLLSTYSIPIAVSRLVSIREAKKEFRNSYKVLKTTFLFASLVGLIMSMLVWYFAGPLSQMLFKSASSAIPLRALSPTIFVFSMMGVLRGFYQGKNTVIPTRISQILEQIVHVAVGLALASMFMKTYADNVNAAAYGAAGGTFGTLAGAVVAFIFLGGIYLMYRPTLTRRLRRDKSGHEETNSEVFLLLVMTALPIILNQFLYSVTGTLDSALFNNILSSKGIEESVRNSLVGIYSGKFRLLTNVPLAIASAIGVAVIPNIVKVHTSGTREMLYDKIHQAVKFNMLIAMPCAAGLTALAGPIMMTLFPTAGDRSFEISKELMLIGSASVIFFAYSTTTNNILQGLGKLKYPVIHATIGIICYLLVDFPLLKFTTMGVYVLPIGYMVFPFVVAVLNCITITRETGYRQDWMSSFIKPFLFSVIMGCTAYLFYTGLFMITKHNTVCLIVTIIASMFIYFFLVIFTRTIDREELKEFPMGMRVIGLLDRLGIRI